MLVSHRCLAKIRLHLEHQEISGFTQPWYAGLVWNILTLYVQRLILSNTAWHLSSMHTTKSLQKLQYDECILDRLPIGPQSSFDNLLRLVNAQ